MRAKPPAHLEWSSTAAPARASRSTKCLKLLEKITGKKLQAKYEPLRVGDIRDSQADISLARKILGYNPAVGFEDGLERTWQWYKSAYAKK